MNSISNLQRSTNGIQPGHTVDNGSIDKMLEGVSLPHFTGFTEAEINDAIGERFERIVQLYPDQIAVRSDEQSLTYGALNRQANTLAHALIAHLGEGNEPVALLFDHDVPLIVALMGVLKAGKAYLVLDQTHPPDRLAARLADLQARLLVTSETYATLASQIAPADCKQLRLDRLPVTAESTQNLAILARADQAAGLFSTSGSTGTPKTVARKHNTLLHRVWLETNEEQITTADRFILLYACSYAGSANHLFCALLNGAQLCLYDIRRQGIVGLATWLQQYEISCMHITVPLFRQFLNMLQPTDFFPTMRQVIPASQQIYKSDLTHFWHHFPATCRIISRFAASETAIVCRMVITQDTEIRGNVVPAGYPVPGKEVLILDEAGNPLGPNQVGEIAVRSRYLAAGYWGKPALTQEKFITTAVDKQSLYRMGDWGRLHADGCLEFLGRKDEMVKIRGYQVQLGEVEAALHTLPMVKAAAVLIHPGISTNQSTNGPSNARPANPTLVAYIVAKQDPAPTASELRTALAMTLPDAMIPGRFILLPELPVTPRGRIDQKRLLALGDQALHDRPTLAIPYAPPQTALEEQLVQIWESVLDVCPVGIGDPFLDLGGNSLQAMQLMVDIERKIGVKASLLEFYEQPTIAHQAHYLEQKANNNKANPAPDPTSGITPQILSLADEKKEALEAIYAQIGQPDAEQRWRRPQPVYWHRRRRAIGYALNCLPYSSAVRLLGGFTQQRWVQQHFYKKQVSTLQEFLTMSECNAEQGVGAPHAPPQTIADHLLFGAIHHYQLGLWDTGTDDPTGKQKKPWVEMQNLERIEEAIAQQQGVILLRSHTNASSFLRLLPFPSYRIGQIERHLPQLLANDAAAENILLAQQLNTARQVLEKGGIVTVAADGRHGNSNRGINTNFLGRQHTFHTGFADLALLTGAMVLMVEYAMQRDGRITIDFVGPFDAGDEHESPNERVEQLVSQYVTHYQAMWVNSPWLIPWYQLNWHLTAPRWDGA